MDGPRPRQYPRPQSRSSTHTSASRMTSVSANSSSSQIAASPQLFQSHSTHRYHHNQCSTSSPRPTSGPTPPLSRQESTESARQPTVSSFLLEKLQRERRAEIEKSNQSQSSLPRSNPDMNGSAELGRAPSSPMKTSASEANRPSSSAGHENGKKKGHGVKEMEQVISTLHKQNFDLKLELYHRRERQSTLEERLDALESDRVRMEEVNDKLLIELEKRDKAVEEAVAMIINLETKVDQLFRERTMVQQIENEPFFCPRDYDVGYKTPVPQGPRLDVGKMDDAKVVNRMPSFLSDNSEITKNLRNVYLDSKASVLSLPRVAGSSPEADNVQALGSPTLSVLSESSFVSVYGRKEKGADMDQNDTDVDETLVLDGTESSFTKSLAENPAPRGKARSMSSSRTTGSRTSSAGQYQSITDVIEGSPLQRLERLDMSYTSRRDPRQRGQSQGRDFTKVQFVSHDRPAAQGPMRQDERDTLRKVLTDGPGGVRLHDHGLPPTPDTISSSTLRRLQGSSDTLSQQPDVHEEGSNGVSLNPASHGGKLQNSMTVALPQGGGQTGVVSWASPSRSTIDSLFEHGDPLISRPRSADESTISYGRGQGWDSDDDDDDDTHSLQSSLDIWMREGAPSRNKVQGSPDLFSFPSGGGHNGSWNPGAMYGQGSVSADSTQPPPGFDYMRDLFSLRQGLFANTAPPPPNRRSSLHARTGSSETTSQATGHQDSEKGPTSAKRRSYHSRQNSVDLGRGDALRTPVQRDQFAPPPQPSSDHKQRNYPPISGHQHGARAGLNRLFRRSTSGAPAVPASSNNNNQTEAASPETAKNHDAMGLPSWASRSSAVEDDRTSATPPPITFNSRQTRRNTMGAEGESERPSTQDLHRSKTPGPATAAAVAAAAEAAGTDEGPVAPSGTGTRRKWLPGFSRTSNSKNKTG
ncbi:hypothetical protein C2857_007594 [Epichloe festucae Fl1]|uniref:Centrosomin N-terminal motif 1 domain-containing protein n=1 Tax=Epichloe festucae (strain Fl1) TaxID=877507 RepID=A0A7S9KQU7_EPIFF|nr:hypothetical protein C2857_007594 [Epichloe festucae Fl1]